MYTQMDILSLPIEIIGHICQYIGQVDYIAFSETCKQINRYVTDPRYINFAQPSVYHSESRTIPEKYKHLFKVKLSDDWHNAIKHTYSVYVDRYAKILLAGDTDKHQIDIPVDLINDGIITESILADRFNILSFYRHIQHIDIASRCNDRLYISCNQFKDIKKIKIMGCKVDNLESLNEVVDLELTECTGIDTIPILPHLKKLVLEYVSVSVIDASENLEYLSLTNECYTSIHTVVDIRAPNITTLKIVTCGHRDGEYMMYPSTRVLSKLKELHTNYLSLFLLPRILDTMPLMRRFVYHRSVNNHAEMIGEGIFHNLSVIDDVEIGYCHFDIIQNMNAKSLTFTNCDIKSLTNVNANKLSILRSNVDYISDIHSDTVNIERCNIISINNISHCKKLIISGVLSCENIRDMHHIQDLEISECNVSSIMFISDVFWLSIYSCRARVLKDMSNITHMTVRSSKIGNIKDIKDTVKSMTMVKVYDADFTDIAAHNMNLINCSVDVLELATMRVGNIMEKFDSDKELSGIEDDSDLSDDVMM
jgi:hypothetical protein